jgi:hypothetical protein
VEAVVGKIEQAGRLVVDDHRPARGMIDGVDDVVVAVAAQQPLQAQGLAGHRLAQRGGLVARVDIEQHLARARHRRECGLPAVGALLQRNRHAYFPNV